MFKMVDLFHGTLEDVNGVTTLAEAVAYIREFWCNDTDEIRISTVKEIDAKRTVDKHTLAIIDENGEYVDIYGLFIK